MIKFNKPPTEEQKKQEAQIAQYSTILKFNKQTPAPVATGPAPSHNLFKSPTDPVVDKCAAYIQKNFADIFTANERRLRNMLKELVPCDLNTVMSWGDQALQEQRDILKAATARMNEFAQLNGSALLTEILNASSKSNKTSFLQRLASGLTHPQEMYGNRIEALKIRLKGISTPLLEYSAKIKDSTLPLWAVTIAAINESVPLSDDITEEAMVNRRRLLQQATQNLQVAAAQLEQTKAQLVKMQSDVDYIMNVVLPSLDLAKP